MRVNNRSEKERRMPTCKELILDLLADYLDQTLNPDVVAGLERHLQVCPPCVAYLNTYKKTKDLAGRGVPVEMPEEMKTRLGEFLLDHLVREKP